MNNEANLWLLAKRRYSLEPNPQSGGFLAFRATLMMAAHPPQTRQANPAAVRAARAEAKVYRFKWPTSPVNPPAIAQRAAPVVPQPETPQPETPQQDALAALLEAKPNSRGRKRKFDIELGWIVLKKTTVRAANIEEAHILARQTQFPPEALRKAFVTRTVGIDDQTVRLVHEDFGRIHMDHVTGKFVTRIADYDDDYYGDYDDD